MLLNKATFRVYAARAYTNDLCTGTPEFNADIKVFDKITRMLKKWQRGKDINIRLLVNYFIFLRNNFQIAPSVAMMMFKGSEAGVDSEAKTVLCYLNMMKETEIRSYAVDLDPRLSAALSKELTP